MKEHKKIRLSTALLLILACTVTAACVTVYSLWGYFNNMLGDLGQLEDRYSKLEEVSGLIDKYFVGEQDKDAMMDAAVAAYVGAMGDKWSDYFTAEEYALLSQAQENSYVGVGITVTQQEEYVYVVTSVTKDSPAEAAGMKVMDRIAAVDGSDVREFASFDALIQAVKGESGTPVTITVERGEHKLDLTMNRATVYYETISAELLDNGLGYVYISGFEHNTAREFEEKVNTLITRGANGLVFDVRFNNGGLLTEMVAMLDVLLPEGTIISTAYKNGEIQKYTSGASCVTLPMAVICNEYSISAAEFFAAALQEYGVATVVGQHTGGKGYGQNMIELADGSALYLSVLRYFTPKGVSLADRGVTPDLEAVLSEEAMTDFYNLSYEQDTQLVAACQAIFDKK